MPKQTAQAQWNGTLKEGHGVMSLQSGAYNGDYTFASRFEEGNGTNPEELAGAAHAGCFSMFLSALLSKENLSPESINTTATVSLDTTDNGPEISSIVLDCQAKVDGIDNDVFQALVTKAKENCPISKLFAGTSITVNATLN